MRRRRFLAAAGTAVTAGCSGLPWTSDPELHPDRIATKTHQRVNDRRERNGVGTLGYDEALERIAAAHSEDMAERNYFAHADPEGHKWEYRYEQAGYECAINVDGGTVTGGENIFQITFSDEDFTDEDIAFRTVKGWMNSPEHRRNMLRAYWTVEGIGVHVEDGEETTVTITQNFC